MRHHQIIQARIIQGGMGIGVSGWQLAGAVARAHGLGVVSGVALDTILVRGLQDGDEDGNLRRALSLFPDQELAAWVLARYFVPGGRGPGKPYRPIARLTLNPSLDRQRLAVIAAFVEVTLAKQAANGAAVGINLMEKVQLAVPAAAYGAMLAGVDAVLVGAGIPARLPWLLDSLSDHGRVEFPIDVVGAPQPHTLDFDPLALIGPQPRALSRPLFLAIVSSFTLASFLARDGKTRPDGFVVEGAVAGGHNAPPRGPLRLNESGEPVYGPRDIPDPAQFVALGLPFWLAGGFSKPEAVTAALSMGATGVQVGTPFALARESGLSGSLRQALLEHIANEDLEVRTDVRASPTSFPFKVAQLSGTLSDPAAYEERPRVCDLSYLRVPCLDENGDVVYRCPAEPVDAYIRKGGARSDTVGRVCLCNALTAAVGIAQQRPGGVTESPIVTLGADVDGAMALLRQHPNGWGAADVMAYLTRSPIVASTGAPSMSLAV
ncbi:MAG TPA: nitronate monooxygenase [Acidimicrobiales bacterium]|nr:nitronate monooxygenase [Acidimicrobiales bacterium]